MVWLHFGQAFANTHPVTLFLIPRCRSSEPALQKKIEKAELRGMYNFIRQLSN
jgi:hypothetical protein